jgi:hypothetical protein
VANRHPDEAAREDELQREIATTREDLLNTVRQMQAAIRRQLSVHEQIRARPALVLALGAAAGIVVLLYGARLVGAARRPRARYRLAGALRALCRG